MVLAGDPHAQALTKILLAQRSMPWTFMTQATVGNWFGLRAHGTTHPLMIIEALDLAVQSWVCLSRVQRIAAAWSSSLTACA
jgi:hypothetical protein